MNRRYLLGGIGAAGAIAVGAYFQAGSRRETETAAGIGASQRTAARPMLVFVGHEL